MIRFFALAPALLLASGVAPAAAGELITNGSFAPDLAPWALSNPAPGADFEHAANFGRTDLRSIRFGAASSPTLLAQPVALAAGQQYQLNFWVHNLGVGDDFLSVQLSGGAQDLLLSGIVQTGLEFWQLVTIDFTPSANASALEFRGRDQIATFYLDDVSLNAVPSPSALSLFALTTLPLTARRRVAK